MKIKLLFALSFWRLVDKSNPMDTVIKDGYAKFGDIYKKYAGSRPAKK